MVRFRGPSHVKDYEAWSYFPVSKLSGDGSDDSDGRDGNDGSDGRAGNVGAAAAGAGVLDTTSGVALAVIRRGGTCRRLTSTGAQPLVPQTFRAFAAVPKAAPDKAAATARTASAIWRNGFLLAVD